jgi:single-stranded DNA-binding protein
MLRETPLGRSVCDLMLAVNRSYGRSDYLPCICWGSSAKEAADWTAGTVIALSGRFQSRDYRKLLPDGSYVEKTAYEISAMEIERLEKTTR